MLWSIVDFEAFHDPEYLLWWERFIERGRLMRIKIIHYQYDFCCIWLHLIWKIFYFSAQSTAVRCSWTLVWCFPSRSSANAKMLQVLFCIYLEGVFLILSDLIGRGADITKQLVWFFMHAYDRAGIIGTFIDIKNIFHTRYEFGISFFGDAPIFVSVRLKPFFKAR